MNRTKTNEKELAKIMMSKKSKRLYERMEHGLQKKADHVEKLVQKRKAIEKKGGQNNGPNKRQRLK